MNGVQAVSAFAGLSRLLLLLLLVVIVVVVLF